MDWLVFREPFSAWSHAGWMLLSLPATMVLWLLARGDRLKQLGLAVFGLSMTACFAGSTLYHGVRLPGEDIEWFATLDYVGVHLLIAGTVTPLALVVLRGHWRWLILALAWLLAAGGIGLRLAGVPLSRPLSTGLYLGMGWAVFLCYFELVRVLSQRAVRPALLGGLVYSLGAVLNHLDWPVLWPGVFSAHELWHVFVMVGSLSHYWLMLTVVVPFERRSCTPAGLPLAVRA
jgi:hemolysin III